MRLLTALCALGLAGLAAPQIPLPPFGSTYQATMTRGFFFQTPIPLVVTGLMVPDEKQHGLQNVELYKLAGAPPAYSSTAQGGQVFYKVGAPSNTVIPVAPPVVYLAGEWLGVLGACGDASMLYNSYATGAFPTTVLGQPITLYRFLTQTSLVTSGGNQPYSSEGNGSIARVWVYVATGGQGIPYGLGTGAGTAPAPGLVPSAPPCLGLTAGMTLVPKTTANQGGVVLLSLTKVVLPFLHGYLFIAPPGLFNFLVPGPIAAAGGTLNLPIPNDPNLLGAPPLFFQGFVVTSPTFTFTNGVEWRLGL